MTIDLTLKTYNDNTYYDYYIDKLCLRSELKRYVTIEKKAHDIIKEFKKAHENEDSVDSFRDSHEEPIWIYYIMLFLFNDHHKRSGRIPTDQKFQQNPTLGIPSLEKSNKIQASEFRR